MNSRDKINTLCVANKLGLTQGHHVWIFDAVLIITKWWEQVPSDCEADITKLVEQSFLMGVEYFSIDNEVTATGKVFQHSLLSCNQLVFREVVYLTPCMLIHVRNICNGLSSV